MTYEPLPLEVQKELQQAMMKFQRWAYSSGYNNGYRCGRKVACDSDAAAEQQPTPKEKSYPGVF